MAEKVSKRVANREAIARTVISSVQLHGPEIVEPLEQQLWPEGRPDEMSIEALIDTVGSYLARSTATLHQSDIALSLEIADDDPVRHRRDENVSRVRTTLVDFTALISGSYGSDQLSRYGLNGETPRNVEVLRNSAEQSVALLRTRAFGCVPKPGRPELDREAMADELEGALEDLKSSLEAIKREEREYQLALTARDHDLVAWDRAYRGVAGLVSSLFLLAGLDELAGRVRPTGRRRIGRPEPEDLSTESAAPAESATPAEAVSTPE